MLNIDVDFSHTFVKYKIDNDEQFACELADSLGFIWAGMLFIVTAIYDELAAIILH